MRCCGELAALRVDDARILPDGTAAIWIGRSKTDQLGRWTPPVGRRAQWRCWTCCPPTETDTRRMCTDTAARQTRIAAACKWATPEPLCNAASATDASTCRCTRWPARTGCSARPTPSPRPAAPIGWLPPLT
jgi:hypothetical protein